MAASIEFSVVYSGSSEATSSAPLVSPGCELLQDPDDVVIDKASIRVAVSYPLSREFLFTVTPPNGAASFTRVGLVKTNSTLYQRICDEETGYGMRG